MDHWPNLYWSTKWYLRLSDEHTAITRRGILDKNEASTPMSLKIYKEKVPE